MPGGHAGSARSDAVRHDGQVTGRPDHCDVAVPIGTEQRHSEPTHLGEQQRRRMPVVVVDADADHSDLGVHGGEEVRIEVRRTVVRHLQHVGAQVGAGCDEVLLRLDLGIAGQEDPHAAHLGAEYQRGVVRVRVRAAIRGGRTEYLQVDGPNIEVRADPRRP